MVNADNTQEFVAIAGFRTAIPPDRPDLLLMEIKLADGNIARFSMTKDSAVIFGQAITKAASPIA